MATIRDVAEAAGVSVATVSRVLNGNGEVSEDKKKRVLAATKKLNYTLSKGNASVSAPRRSTILALLPNTLKSFYDEVIIGLQIAAKESGYDLILGVCNNNPYVEAEHVEKLSDGTIAAIVFLGTFMRGEEIAELEKKYNVALCCECVDGANVLSVVTDFEQAAYEAVSYLIEKGHRHVGMISTVSRVWSSQQKEKGYIKALTEHGLYRDEYIFYGHFDNKSGGFAMGYFESLPEPPTAIFSVSDSLAMGLIRTALNKGYKVGENLDVIGFDNTMLCELFNPTISTISQPRREMGTVVMQKLIANMNGSAPRCSDTIFLPHKLILRQSTGEK